MRGWRKIKQIDGNFEVIDRVMMAVERSGTAAVSDTDAVDGFVIGASGSESVPRA